MAKEAKRTIHLTNTAARDYAKRSCDEAPDQYVVQFFEPGRLEVQNDAQWPILRAIAKQKEWPVNGALVFMNEYDWKDVLTAAFQKERVRVALAYDGAGVVMLGHRTREFSKGTFDEWLSFLNAVAAEWGVKLPAPKYRE